MKKTKKRKLKARNPVAKAVTRLRPKVFLDRRRKKIERTEKREAEESE